jgi:hypothetical protein
VCWCGENVLHFDFDILSCSEIHIEYLLVALCLGRKHVSISQKVLETEVSSITWRSLDSGGKETGEVGAGYHCIDA